MANKLFNLAYGLIVLLFLLDNLTSFDIKNQVLKSFIYYGFLVGIPLKLAYNVLLAKKINKKITWIFLPIIVFVLIYIVVYTKFVFSIGVWQTQTILYQNKYSNAKKIEFQMQDIGALGYNKRTVEVLYLTPLFIITSEIPNNIDKKIEWIKVDEDINELELKMP